MSDAREIDRARFLRHLVLTEIGEAGQRRLSRASCEVPSATASALELDVAQRYLTRAGVASVRSTPEPSIEAPAWVTTPAAREVLQGSLAALREIRRALDPSFDTPTSNEPLPHAP